jgi:alkylation response protein AidB-like acyl-CoA dehydrogenase
MSAFDPAFGGAGLGDAAQQRTLATILRLLGAADLSLARLFEGHVNAIMLVSRYGSEIQIANLSKSVKGGALAGVWGADGAIGLSRARHGDASVLRGGKIFASGAGFVRRPLVTVATDGGHIMYLLRLDGQEQVDVASWPALGMRASASKAIDLTGITVGVNEEVGSPGDFMRQPFFSAGAWRFCAAQLGAAERLATLFQEQLKAKGRASDPYQLERVAGCAVACTTARFWIEEAALRFGSESLDPSAVVAFANLTRCASERAALDVLELVQRGAGLSAFLRGQPIERISRDLATYLRQPVPDLAMSDAARAILSGHLSIGDIE